MKILRRGIAILAMVLGLSSAINANEVDQNLIKKLDKEFKSLTNEQKLNIFLAYTLGSKHNYGLSAGAISWQESKAGKFQININKDGSMDCGMFGNNTKTILMHAKTKNTIWNKRMVCTKLITNPLYAYEKMIDELELWEKYWTGRTDAKNLWYSIWGSYNGGVSPNYNYAKRIHHKIIVIAKHLNYLKKLEKEEYGSNNSTNKEINNG